MKNTIEECREIAKQRGGDCLSTKYTNNREKLEWKCSKGHIWLAALSHIKSSNSWCPACCGNLNNSLELCNEVAASRNGKCLSAKYTNALSMMEWQCEKNHIWQASFSKIKSLNRWCPYCAGVARLTIDECIELAISRGGKCLSDKYKNNREYMSWQCDQGHIWNAKYNFIKLGQWCPYCVGKYITIQDCKELAISKNGECLSNIYVNVVTKLIWQCDKEHIWEASLNNIKNSGTWCPKCCFNNPREQQNIEAYINGLGFTTTFNDRSIIPPLELDIYIPEKKIAIEYCGLYWHGEKMSTDNAKYRHFDKLNICNAAGIRLITIFEDEWLFRKERVAGYLKAIFGIAQNKIDARKCVISNIDSNTAKLFHDDSHIQGHANGKHIGLYFNNQLVCLATFAKPSASRNAHRNNEDKMELMRYTAKINYSIRGGLGKLLKAFIRTNLDIREIISYSDNRWSIGNIYRTLGFELINTGKPSYFYFQDKKNERHHRYNFTKHRVLKLFGGDPKQQTEWDIMSKNGYDRIWDCGSSKWALKIT